MQATSIPSEQIEEAANEVLDYHARMGRPLNRAERRDFAPILELYESWLESDDYLELPNDTQARHEHTIDALRKVISPPPPEDVILEPLSLPEIESRILCVLDIAETWARPLLPEERKPYRDLLANCYSESTRDAIAALPSHRHDHYYRMFAELREVVEPDPPVGDGQLLPPLTRTHESQRIELHAGNFAPRIRVLEGLAVRRLTAEETRARLTFIGRLVCAIGVLARELAMASPQHRCVVQEVARAGQYATACARRFTQTFDPDGMPADLTPDEVSEHARIMGEFTGDAVDADFEGD